MSASASAALLREESNPSHATRLLYEKLRARNALTGRSSVVEWGTAEVPREGRGRRPAGEGDPERRRALVRRRVRDAIFTPGRDALRTFAAFDAERSGALSVTAMCTVLAHLGADVSSTDAACVFTPDLRVASGGVAYREFVKRMDDESAIECARAALPRAVTAA